jgi:small subunit ribosomal protein S6
MRHYEGTIVLDPELQDDGYNKQLDRIKKFIEERGGKIVEDDRWGLRNLAYEIKKHSQGYYGVLEWEGPGELIGDLDHMLRLDENILRHLIIHFDTKVIAEREEIKLRSASRPDLVDRDEDSDLDEEDEDDFGNDFDEDIIAGKEIGEEEEKVEEEVEEVAGETGSEQAAEEPEEEAETGSEAEETGGSEQDDEGRVE